MKLPAFLLMCVCLLFAACSENEEPAESQPTQTVVRQSDAMLGDVSMPMADHAASEALQDAAAALNAAATAGAGTTSTVDIGKGIGGVNSDDSSH